MFHDVGGTPLIGLKDVLWYLLTDSGYAIGSPRDWVLQIFPFRCETWSALTRSHPLPESTSQRLVDDKPNSELSSGTPRIAQTAAG